MEEILVGCKISFFFKRSFPVDLAGPFRRLRNPFLSLQEATQTGRYAGRALRGQEISTIRGLLRSLQEATQPFQGATRSGDRRAIGGPFLSLQDATQTGRYAGRALRGPFLTGRYAVRRRSQSGKETVIMCLL